MRIGVYPGSFDPVHKGHIAIVRHLLKKKYVDQVLIVPTGNYWYKQDLPPVEERIRLLEIFANEKFRIEKELNELPYTYQLMQALQQRHPEEELSLIMGADTLVRFDQWKEYQDLLQYEFLVIPREGTDPLPYLQALPQEKYQIIEGLPLIKASSTYIREHLDDYEAIKEMIDIRVWRKYRKLRKK